MSVTVLEHRVVWPWSEQILLELGGAGAEVGVRCRGEGGAKENSRGWKQLFLLCSLGEGCSNDVFLFLDISNNVL